MDLRSLCAINTYYSEGRYREETGMIYPKMDDIICLAPVDQLIAKK